MVTEQKVEQFQKTCGNIFEQISRDVICQKEVVEGTVIAMIAGGNVLLEGVPGVGKTRLVRSLGRVFSLPFSRIQFTPDLMPADVTGTNIIVKDAAGNTQFQFQPGPVFSNIVLADEINRATPKTQSVLLEAMQEHTVTVMGVSRKLNEPFFVLATLSLELRADLAGFFGGKHLVRTYGQTVEFADYREYMLGDDIRRIDWKIYSRFEKFFIKLFTDERQMHTQIFLDCSASMGKDNDGKASYAVGIAAALGYLSVHNMDKVSFRLIKGDRAENPYGTIVGKRAFFRAVSELDAVTFDGEAELAPAILGGPDTGGNDGLTVIVSDFFTDSDWKKAVDYLLYKKRQVFLIQTLTPDELEPLYQGRVNLIDSESADLLDARNMKLKINRASQQAYDEALRNIVGDIRQFCASRDVSFVSVRIDRQIEKTLFTELLKVGIMA